MAAVVPRTGVVNVLPIDRQKRGRRRREHCGTGQVKANRFEEAQESEKDSRLGMANVSSDHGRMDDGRGESSGISYAQVEENINVYLGNVMFWDKGRIFYTG